MPGELVPRRSSGQLQRATTGALNEVMARQIVTERIIKAKSQVGEYATSEAVYLKALQKIAETSNPDAADAVASIINMTVAGIIRTNGEFGSSL
jgi:3-dehydroquinate dehydratase